MPKNLICNLMGHKPYVEEETIWGMGTYYWTVCSRCWRQLSEARTTP